MAEQGAPTSVIGQALGHLNPATTRIYTRIHQESVAQAKSRTHVVMMRGEGGVGGEDGALLEDSHVWLDIAQIEWELRPEEPGSP